MHFPKGFLWGASTAGHQVEGGLENQWTRWELENAKSLAARAPYRFDYLEQWDEIKQQAADPDNYVSGRGVEHYQRFSDDVQLLRKLHMNSYRFSIEWSRIEPQPGVWSAESIAHYKARLKTLKDAGITPVVTLFHFALPTWFADMGGFEKYRNIKYFVRYADKILTELGHDLEWIITINEPTVYATESYYWGHWPPARTSKRLTFEVLQNLIRAHKKVYRLTKKNPRWKISMAHNVSHYYAGDTAWLSEVSAKLLNYRDNVYTLRRVRRQSDFIALNYYFSNRVYGYRVHNPEDRVSDLGWDLQPGDLRYVLEDLQDRYGLPILITENGLADADDTRRQWWLTETIRAMHESLKKGVKLVGYLHWSLLDNFEWDKGYWPRFGLVAVDRATMKRTIRPSAQWLGRVIQKLRS